MKQFFTPEDFPEYLYQYDKEHVATPEVHAALANAKLERHGVIVDGYKFGFPKSKILIINAEPDCDN